MAKILIADDSMFMRKVLRDILTNKSADTYDIVEADSGASTLKQFKKQKPDLVLLDIIMPGGKEEGVSTLRRILEADPGARVVMVTAVGQDAVIEECMELGARGYVVKPFRDEQVLEVVHEQLS